MAHDKDREHPPPPAPPKEPALASRGKPDCKRVEHPTAIPREPVDPRTHPKRPLMAASPGARPA